MDYEDLIKAHEYFLKQPQKMNAALQAYKCNPVINKLFYGLSLTNEEVILVINKLNSGCKPRHINNGFNFLTLLGEIKKEYIDNFNLDLMDKSFKNKLSSPIIVYRGGPFVDQFPGYTSTSLDMKVALEFMSTSHYLYSIVLPKGTPYVYLESNKKDGTIVGDFRYEYEILLPRGAQFKVLKKEIKDMPNPHYIHSKLDPVIKVSILHVEVTGFKPQPIVSNISFNIR